MCNRRTPVTELRGFYCLSFPAPKHSTLHSVNVQLTDVLSTHHCWSTFKYSLFYFLQQPPPHLATPGAGKRGAGKGFKKPGGVCRRGAVRARYGSPCVGLVVWVSSWPYHPLMSLSTKFAFEAGWATHECAWECCFACRLGCAAACIRRAVPLQCRRC